jgi:hypothetical protein
LLRAGRIRPELVGSVLLLCVCCNICSWAPLPSCSFSSAVRVGPRSHTRNSILGIKYHRNPYNCPTASCISTVFPTTISFGFTNPRPISHANCIPSTKSRKGTTTRPSTRPHDIRLFASSYAVASSPFSRIDRGSRMVCQLSRQCQMCHPSINATASKILNHGNEVYGERALRPRSSYNSSRLRVPWWMVAGTMSIAAASAKISRVRMPRRLRNVVFCLCECQCVRRESMAEKGRCEYSDVQ